MLALALAFLLVGVALKLCCDTTKRSRFKCLSRRLSAVWPKALHRALLHPMLSFSKLNEPSWDTSIPIHNVLMIQLNTW